MTVGVSGRATGPPRSPGALQALVCLGAGLVVLPLLVREDAPWWALLYLGVAVLLAAAAWLRQGVGSTTAPASSLLAHVGTALAVGGLVVVLSVAGDAVLDLLLVSVALCTVVAVSPGRRAAWSFQGAILALLCAGMLLAGLPWPVALAVTAQVAVVVVLADAIGQRLSRVGAAEQHARRAAERRGALLGAVRDLPRHDVDEAETAVVRTLRSLAFDAAGVARMAGDVLIEGALEGLPRLEVPLRRGEGLAWRAIEEDRTIALGDYEHVEERLSSRQGVRGVVVTPIRIEGRPVGVLVGTRCEPRWPRGEEVEVAEVMAAHLGGVLANHASQQRQRRLLEQAAHLDHLSQSLLEAVSEEIRDPLTVLRLGAQLLSEHAADLDPVQRAGLLARVERESDELCLVIDTILDFSRYHARRTQPRREPAALHRLLTTAGIESTQAAAGHAEPVPPDLRLLVDLELLVPALRLLLASGTDDRGQPPLAQLSLVDGALVLELPRSRVGPSSSVLVQLAEQLLTAGGGRLELDEHAPAARIQLGLVAPLAGAGATGE